MAESIGKTEFGKCVVPWYIHGVGLKSEEYPPPEPLPPARRDHAYTQHDRERWSRGISGAWSRRLSTRRCRSDQWPRLRGINSRRGTPGNSLTSILAGPRVAKQFAPRIKGLAEEVRAHAKLPLVYRPTTTHTRTLHLQVPAHELSKPYTPDYRLRRVCAALQLNERVLGFLRRALFMLLWLMTGYAQGVRTYYRKRTLES